MNNLTGLGELSMPKSEEKKWYVMRDLKRVNALLPAYRQLADLNMEVFTPMRERLIVRKGKKIREQVPYLQDLLFVHESRQTLDPVVAKTPTLQYRYMKGVPYLQPMTVPDHEMNRFILAVKSSKNLHYYKPDEITPDMHGARIRIIGGTLDNYEGFLLTTRGTKVKRLLVELPGIISAAVQIVDCEYAVLM